jgi:NADH:ubiquinone oxidoreductase subunit F (NADH-binding)
MNAALPSRAAERRAASPRLLAGFSGRGAVRHAQHLAIHGPLPRAGAELIDAVAAAGLRGRGGAGFPAGTKLAAVAAGRRPVVVVNGTEGEPMSAKDVLLLTRAPHLVLDGAVLAAGAVGAREIHVVAPQRALATLVAALGQREERADIRLLARAPGYVAGEETAVLAHLEGRPPRPRLTPQRPAERGFRRRPTLVQNVETLAHIALIARHGPAWFRTTGTAERPGTMLVTVSGAVRAPGVLEVEPGLPLDALLAAAGGPREPLRALLVGGYFGAWVEPGPGLRLDDAALAAHGAAVGAGVVVALGASACPVAETARLTAWLAAESAGQCGPCVHGLGALADLLGRLAAGRVRTGDMTRLERWTSMVRRRGACAHPDGVARMLTSARTVFAAELEDHARRGPCAACRAPSPLRLPPRLEVVV